MPHEPLAGFHRALAQALHAASLEEYAWSGEGLPQDYADANVLLAALAAWIGQKPDRRIVHTEWWATASRWVCKITQFHYLQPSTVSIGQHPTDRTLAEAQALLAALTEAIES